MHLISHQNVQKPFTKLFKKKEKKKEETKTDQIQLKELSTFFLFIAMDFEYVNHQYVQFLFLFFTNYLTNKESGTFDNTATI